MTGGRTPTERQVVTALGALGRSTSYIRGYIAACRVYGYKLPPAAESSRPECEPEVGRRR